MRRKVLEAALTRAVRYSPALGAKYGVKTAQQVGCEVESMLSEGLTITPSNLLLRAGDPESVLHALFTWNTEEAAAKYRLHEARQILNHLEVVTMQDGQKVVEKALYSVVVTGEDDKGGNKRSYHFAAEVAGDEQMQARLKEDAWQSLRRFVETYARWQWEEFAPVCSLVIGDQGKTV
jgi:hypothetical protein